MLPDDGTNSRKIGAEFIYFSTNDESDGAIAAFDCYDELDAHIPRYQENRDFLYRELSRIFLGDHAPSDGAFYLYADVSALTHDLVAFAGAYLQRPVLQSRQVLILTPAKVKHVRLSYAGSARTSKRRFSALIPGLQNQLAWPTEKKDISSCVTTIHDGEIGLTTANFNYILWS